MAIIARYDFGGSGSVLADGTPAAGYQNGVLRNGAVQQGGELHLDGTNDHARLTASDAFQLPQGTLDISFSQTQHTGLGEDTVLSRDSAGMDNGGQFSLATTANGSVVVHHNTATTNTSYSTPAGFFSDADTLKVSYSWDASGKGGAYIVENLTSGARYSETISAALTMDMGASDNEPWVIGASAERSLDGQANRLSEHFQGTVDALSFSDSVDNLPTVLDGVVEGTAGDDLIDIFYTGDPDGDRIDAGDAILPGAAPDDDYVLAGAGNDTVLAGVGDDQIFGEDGDDLVRGLGGDDYIDGGAGNDTLDGGGDDDTVLGGLGADVLTGDAGDDLLDGGADDDNLFGGTGDDTLIGGAGSDTQFGGDDRDTFFGTTAGDSIDGGEGGNDFDTLDLRDWGKSATNIIYDPTNPENGIVEFLDPQGNITGTLTFENIENIVPCFTPGTMIATPLGERRVEELQAGDRVITRDNGIQEIRWVGQKSLTFGQLTDNAHLKPVMVSQGSLGDGLPERDMMVSPNHRLLVSNERTMLYFEEHEVLVAAKHLANNTGIRKVEALGVTYVHFMCDRHEVVLADGCWTESFQPGDYSLNGLGNAQRAEIYELFPALVELEGRRAYKSARRTLKRHEAQILRF